MARRPLEPGGSLPSEAALGTNTPSELGRSIVTVEKATKRLLPSTITAALAQSGLDEKSLTRAAQIVAKNFDLDPAYFWGTSTPTDPYTGGPLSLATFRRLTEDAKPEVLKAMAPSLFAMQSTDERVMERPWLTNMNAGKLSQVLRAAGPVLAPFHIAAHEGVALAAEVLRQGANGKRFAQNLQAVIGWYNLDKNSLMKGRELDWVALSNIALEASVAKRNLTSPVDVRAFLYPEIADKARRGSRAEANADASQSNAMYAGGKGTDWLNVTSDLTPVARAFLAGDYANPEVKKFLDEKFGNAEEIAKARDIVRRQALIEEARRIQAETTVTTMGIGGGGRGATEIRDVEGLAEAKDLLSRGSPDWYKGAEVLQNEIIDSKTAFERSFVGGALLGGMEALGWVFEQGQKGIINVAALSVPVLEAIGQDEMAGDYAATYAQYRQAIQQGHGIFETMGKKYGWHPIVGASMDFLAGIATDPLIWWGRGVRGFRQRKYAPLLDKRITAVEGIARKVPAIDDYLTWRAENPLPLLPIPKEWKLSWRDRFYDSVSRFSKANAKPLAEALASGDPQAVRNFINEFGTHIQTGTALDEALIQKAQRIFANRYSGGVTDAAVDEVEHLLQSMFGVPRRPGSLAEAAWTTRTTAEATAARAADQLPVIQGRVYAVDESGLLLPEATARDLVEDAITRHVVTPQQLEVPYRLRPIPGFGLKRSVQNAVAGSDLFDDPASVLSKGQRKTTQLLGINPGNVLNINEDPARWARLVANRAGDFTPKQVDSIVDDINKAVIGGNPEVAIESVIEKRIIQPVLAAEAKRMKIPAIHIPAIREELERAVGQWRKQLFGVVEGKNIRRPVLDTQRVNELVFPDVLQVKKFVRKWSMAHADFLESAPSKELRYLIQSEEAWSKVSPFLRSVARGWKTLVVPRGGYFGRVVLLDEGFGRWFASGASLMEHAVSMNIDEAISATLKASTLGLTPGRVSNAVGKVIGKPIEALTDWAYPAQRFKVAGEIVELPKPRQMAYEPYANTSSRPREVYEDIMRRANQLDKEFKFSNNWGRVTPDDPTYFSSLELALNNQLGRGVFGPIALESVRNGDSVVQTTRILVDYARKQGRSYIAQMGWADDVEEWATLLAKMAHGYTMGSKELADFALRHQITESFLREKLPKNALPDIHGPLLQQATFGTANPLPKVTEYLYKTFVQMPENVINRQPYYRFWKRRAELAYYSLAEAQYGKDALVSLEAIKSSIDEASRQFALKQVKRIMFDFAENSRLGELLYGAFPFMQPYLEAFSVWGHLIWHRNPAVVGYAQRLWDAGKASGFIRKDPQSGEWVIPTTFWSASSVWLGSLAGVEGASILTPVKALNLFASSAIRIAEDAPVIGKLVGGASLPIPSLSPPALFLLQHLFKDTDSQALSSWLFAFGPNTSFVPTSLNKALMATFPDLYEDGVLNAIAMDYIIDYEYRGVYQDLEPTELQAQAISDARKHMGVRAFLAFNGIGVGLVRWEWAPIRQEYFDLIEQFGGDTQKAKEAFLTKYPDYKAMTVGKTEVGKGLSWVDSGNNIIPGATGLRLPSSEYARRFLNSEAGKDLMAEGFGPVIGAMLLQADESLQDNDFATYSQYLAQGLIKTKDLIDYIRDIEQVGVTDDNPETVGEHEGFWGAITSFNEYVAAQRESLYQEGFREGDNAFDELKLQRTKFLLEVEQHFPLSFERYLNKNVSEVDPDDVLEVTWKMGETASGEPNQLVLAKLRQFASIPQIQDFNVVKGLNYYFDNMETIREEMIAEGIDSIEDAGAVELGLDVEYQKLLDEVESKFPEASIVVNSFLRDVLTSEPTAGEVTLRDWRKSSDPRYAQYQEFETSYRRFTDALGLVSDSRPSARSNIYTQISALFNATYQNSPDVIEAWWNKKSYGQRQQYERGLTTRYVGYMSLWDLHLLGLDVSSGTAAQMATVAQRRLLIQVAQDDSEKFDSSAAYDEVEAIELSFAKVNPEYAEVLNAQRTWGYALARSPLVQGDTQAAEYWRSIASSLSRFQAIATSQKLTGSKYGSADKVTAYKELQVVLESMLRAYSEDDSLFQKQYRSLNYGGDLVSSLIPTYYFDYPLGPVSPRQAQ